MAANGVMQDHTPCVSPNVVSCTYHTVQEAWTTGHMVQSFGTMKRIADQWACRNLFQADRSCEANQLLPKLDCAVRIFTVCLLSSQHLPSTPTTPSRIKHPISANRLYLGCTLELPRVPQAKLFPPHVRAWFPSVKATMQQPTMQDTKPANIPAMLSTCASHHAMVAAHICV